MRSERGLHVENRKEGATVAAFIPSLLLQTYSGSGMGCRKNGKPQSSIILITIKLFQSSMV
jgi:hypothetical protein